MSAPNVVDTVLPVAAQPWQGARPWRDVLKVHPVADMFPLLADNELRELANDIAKNGLTDRIVYTGTPGAFVVLDGRNRLDALLWHNHPVVDEHGHPLPEYCEYREHVPDVTAWIISKNIRRRHLTAAQKRNLIAKLLTVTPQKSNRAVAKTVGVDHKTVSAVRDALQSGGEIPHVEKLIGSDGKAQPAKKTTAPKHAADGAAHGGDDGVQVQVLAVLLDTWDAATRDTRKKFLTTGYVHDEIMHIATGRKAA